MKILKSLVKIIILNIFRSSVIQCNTDIDFRIVGGRRAIVSQFPWQVGIELHHKGSLNSFCGGTLISDIWVLTAAHCSSEGLKKAVVIVGTAKINPYVHWFLPTERRHIVELFIVHDSFDAPSLVNDIALMKLKKPVQFGVLIQPIALDDESLIDPNMLITICGWGKTGQRGPRSMYLKFIDMLVITTQECQAFYKSRIQFGSTFCAIGEGNDNICVGDSGGGAIIYKNGIPVHVGLLSFLHSSGCEEHKPVGFSRTSIFRDWIREVSGV